MKRKVVKHGPATLIVSIPSGWAKKYGIKQGDELDVDEQGSRLVIDVKKEQAFPELSIDVSNFSTKLISRYLINAYQTGYDKLKITYKNPSQCMFIQSKISEFLGYEIMERTNENCTISSITSKIDLDFQSSVKKLFLLGADMINSLYEAYKENNKKDLANIRYKDILINKYAYFCLRTINKGLYTGPEQATHNLYHLIIILENLADDYKKLSALLVNFQKDKDILGVISKIKDYFELAHDFFYKPDKEKLLQAMSIDQQIIKIIKQGFKNTKTTKKLLILTLLNNITQTNYHLTSRRLTTLKF